MSDNESFESQTETEGSTDNEDIAEQSSVVQPYQFEPVAEVTTRKTKRTKTAFFVKLLRRDLRKL
jgi:hypothetical protein